MSPSKVDNILHPVRAKIIMKLLRRKLTPLELAARMPDVPQATLYRHLNALAEAGYLKVVEERQVHSVTEKVYTLDESVASLRPEDVASLDAEGHLRLFRGFIARVLGTFELYIGRGKFDIGRDRVGYFMMPMYLTDQETDELGQRVNALIAPYLQQQPAPGRKRRMVAMISLPDVEEEEGGE